MHRKKIPLSVEEKIETAIEYVIKNQSLKNSTPYKNVNELRVKNPNCCFLTTRHKLDSRFTEGFNLVEKISIWDKLSGVTTIAVVHYVELTNKKYDIGESELLEKYFVLDDCGNKRDYFYQRYPIREILVSPLLYLMVKYS